MRHYGKAFMRYVQQVAERGERKCSMRVRRSQAFWDAFRDCQDQGILRHASSKGLSTKVFPQFVLVGGGAS